DISFDLSLIETYGCQVYAFDPTPRSIAWVKSQNLPPEFHFFASGIAAHDGEVTFNPPINLNHVSYTMLERPETAKNAIQVPVFRLQTILQRLNHRRLDILKMDVEGAEYQVIQQLCESDFEIGQLLVEFHHRFAAVGWQQTQTAVHALQQKGFKTFFVSPTVEEFSFLGDGS
ncbi:MAG: FkbM family methyltransferase, partial [Anaerolineales bacterium]|nr:FkbM family methyltransferase [Anaerolineales bacterium]